MAIVGLVIYLIFAVVWYLPLYKKQPQDVSGTLSGEFMTTGSGKELIGLAILLVSLTVDIVFIVKTLKSVRRSAEKTADAS